MCNSCVHELSNEVTRISKVSPLTLTEKWKLLEAFIRDSRLTSGEELAKLTAGREESW